MSRTRWLALALVASGCAGSAGSAGGASPGPGVAGDCVTGAVGVLGTEGAAMTVIHTDRGAPVLVVGARAQEVRRLSNALVTVCGTRGSGGAVDVSEVELREVDGMPAYLGVLRRVGDGFVVDVGGGRPPVPLVGVPDPLGAAQGGRVWVAGTWGRDGLSVASWGGMLQ